MSDIVWWIAWWAVWYHIGQAIYVNDRAYDARLRKLYRLTAGETP